MYRNIELFGLQFNCFLSSTCSNTAKLIPEAPEPPDPLCGAGVAAQQFVKTRSRIKELKASIVPNT